MRSRGRRTDAPLLDYEKEFAEGQQQAQTDFNEEGIALPKRMARIFARYEARKSANQGYIRGYLARTKQLELGALDW